MSEKVKRIITVLILSAFVIVTPTILSGRAISFKLGDVDLDGTISAADARLVLRASVGLENIEQTPEETKAPEQKSKTEILKDYIAANGTENADGTKEIKSSSFDMLRPCIFAISYDAKEGFLFRMVSDNSSALVISYLTIPENNTEKNVPTKYIKVWKEYDGFRWEGTGKIDLENYYFGQELDFSFTTNIDEVGEQIIDDPEKPHINTRPNPSAGAGYQDFSSAMSGWDNLLNEAGLTGGMSDIGFSNFYGMLDKG